MSRMRETYRPEFKAEAVRLVREDGIGVARVGASLGVNRTRNPPAFPASQRHPAG